MCIYILPQFDLQYDLNSPQVVFIGFASLAQSVVHIVSINLMTIHQLLSVCISVLVVQFTCAADLVTGSW